MHWISSMRRNVWNSFSNWRRNPNVKGQKAIVLGMVFFAVFLAALWFFRVPIVVAVILLSLSGLIMGIVAYMSW